MTRSVPLWISRFSAWAPGMQGEGDWAAWVRGEREIPDSKESPALEYTEPLFRRRLSQISRMTIQVLHDLMPIPEGAKILFSSFRGELSRQFQINKMVIEDGALMPAIFSLSVFNTPPALAAIALKLTAGYSTLYTAEDRWDGVLEAAAAQALSGQENGVVLVYADEQIPPEYRDLDGSGELPGQAAFAFAALLSRQGEGLPWDIPRTAAGVPASPAAFLASLYRQQEHYGGA